MNHDNADVENNACAIDPMNNALMTTLNTDVLSRLLDNINLQVMEENMARASQAEAAATVIPPGLPINFEPAAMPTNFEATLASNYDSTLASNYDSIISENYWHITTPDWSRPQSQSPTAQPPTLNGSPWHGEPLMSSPSPVGSRSSASPPQAAGSPSTAYNSSSSEHNLAPAQAYNGYYPSRRSSDSRSPDEPSKAYQSGGSSTGAISRRSSDERQYYQRYNGGASRRASDSERQQTYYNRNGGSRHYESSSSDEQAARTPGYNSPYNSPEPPIDNRQRRYSSRPTSYQPRKCSKCTRDSYCDICTAVHWSPMKDPIEQAAEKVRQTMNDVQKHKQESDEYLVTACSMLPIDSSDMLMMDMHQEKSNRIVSNSNLVIENQRLIGSASMVYCEFHRHTQKFFCETCSQAYCSECTGQFHRRHVTSHMFSAVQKAEQQAIRLRTEAVNICTTFRQDLDEVQRSYGLLDVRTNEAALSVLDMFKRLAIALAARQKELLNNLKNARLYKLQTLKTREEGIRYSLSTMERTVEDLSNSIEEAKLYRNPINLNVASDYASSEFFQISQVRQSLPPVEENFVSFQAVESSVSDAISNLGNIIFDSGNAERRMLTASNNQPGLPTPTYSGRAISACETRISVTSRRRMNNDPFYNIGQSVRSIGNDCDPEDRVCRPWGVACDKEGHIIIADRSNNRIQIYREDGTFVRMFGTHGNASGQFDRPAGVAVDKYGRIIVADKDNHRVQTLSIEGDFINSFGEKGVGNGQFNYPWDVAVNEGCQIVVSDTRNHRIQLFSPEGVFLRKFGFDTKPVMWKHFDSPRGVAFSPEGHVLVTDFNNHRIIVVESNFLTARILGTDSLIPSGPPPKVFLRPQGIICDDDGNIVVADSRNHRIQIIDKNGVCFARFGSQGTGPDQLDRPSGVALTRDGKIVVVDFGNNRISLF